MVKEYFGTFTFPYRWELVVSGFWVKYPNPYSNHVLSEDVISRYVTDEDVLVTRRLLVKERNFHIPKWAERLINFKHVYVIEETRCDLKNNSFVSTTRNFSSNSMMTVIEKCKYEKDPNDPNTTICQKQAQIYSPLLFGTGSAVEKFAIQRFKKNAERATQGLRWIIEKFQLNRGVVA